jgi:hypothetical protein
MQIARWGACDQRCAHSPDVCGNSRASSGERAATFRGGYAHKFNRNGSTVRNAISKKFGSKKLIARANPARAIGSQRVEPIRRRDTAAVSDDTGPSQGNQANQDGSAEGSDKASFNNAAYLQQGEQSDCSEPGAGGDVSVPCSILGEASPPPVAFPTGEQASDSPASETETNSAESVAAWISDVFSDLLFGALAEAQETYSNPAPGAAADPGVFPTRDVESSQPPAEPQNSGETTPSANSNSGMAQGKAPEDDRVDPNWWKENGGAPTELPSNLRQYNGMLQGAPSGPSPQQQTDFDSLQQPTLWQQSKDAFDFLFNSGGK